MNDDLNDPERPLPIFPGVAHIVLGHPISGLCWMFSICVLYCFFILPGFIFHALSMYEARQIARAQAWERIYGLK